MESDDNCVILAGPGSGKTKTLVMKIAKIVKEEIEYPHKVACITFNNECVFELKNRLNTIIDLESIFVGTLHSFCLQHVILPYHHLITSNFPETIKISSIEVQNELHRETYEELFRTSDVNFYELDGWKRDISTFRKNITDRKSNAWSQEYYMSKYVELYESKLRQRNLIDFDDIVVFSVTAIENHKWLRMLMKSKFPVICIDEYQDLGNALNRIITSLMKCGVRIIAVGDPNQSIYSFNGAKPELLMNLSESELVECITLDINYRCSKEILNASHNLISEKDKQCSLDDCAEGTIKFKYITNGLDSQLEYIFSDLVPSIKSKYELNNSDFAVLYPNKYFGNDIAIKAEEYGYDYIRIDNNAPYQKTKLTRWLEQIALWETEPQGSSIVRLHDIMLVFNQFTSVMVDKDREELREQMIETLFKLRDCDTKLIQWLNEIEVGFLNKLFDVVVLTYPDEMTAYKKLSESAKGKIHNYSLSKFAGQTGSDECINLCTLHSAKGREFEVVIMPGLEEGIFPKYNQTSPKMIAESRRLFYVGLTRAKSEVHITYSGFYKNSYDRIFKQGCSRFINELKSNR